MNVQRAEDGDEAVQALRIALSDAQHKVSWLERQRRLVEVTINDRRTKSVRIPSLQAQVRTIDRDIQKIKSWMDDAMKVLYPS